LKKLREAPGMQKIPAANEIMSGQSGQLMVHNIMMYGGYEPYLNQEGAAKDQRQVGHVPQWLEQHATEPEHSGEAVCAVMTYGERQL
jgi:hypothetical protein